MALNTNEARDSLFGFAKQPAPQEATVAPATKQEASFPPETLVATPKTEQETTAQAAPVPKWQSFDKVMSLLTTEQKEGMDRLAKKLMKARKGVKGKTERERITANTLTRALITQLLRREDLLTLESLDTEGDVTEWIGNIFKSELQTGKQHQQKMK